MQATSLFCALADADTLSPNANSMARRIRCVLAEAGEIVNRFQASCSGRAITSRTILSIGSGHLR
jgi:hypothetical protein